MKRTAVAALVIAMIPLLRCASSAPVAAVTPDVYRARVTTSKGSFVIEVHRDWAPLAADRFAELVHARFYDQARFYRVVPDFVVQFGMNADPAIHAEWQEKKFKDEPARTSNKRGTVCFARSGKADSAATHIFINLADNKFLDANSAPFGVVTSGMDVVDSLYSGYGDNDLGGNGPNQSRLWKEGNAYLLKEFPRLDYITGIAIEPR